MGRFLEKVGWGGQLGGIQNQPGGFKEKRLVTLNEIKINKNKQEKNEELSKNFDFTK